MIDILNYLPHGRNKARSRADICRLTGLDDRQVRILISKAKKETVIASASDGSGYYIPTITDYDEVKSYKNREHAKAINILSDLTIVNAWLDDVEHERLEGDQ